MDLLAPAAGGRPTGCALERYQPEDPWRSVVQPGSNRRHFLKSSETRLSNVPETAFGKDPVGIQPTPLKGASPIDLSVYNPDVDPGYDDLFDLVQGVGENRIQGDAARDAEAERIREGVSQRAICAGDKTLRRRRPGPYDGRHNVPPQRDVDDHDLRSEVWQRHALAAASSDTGGSSTHGQGLLSEPGRGKEVRTSPG